MDKRKIFITGGTKGIGKKIIENLLKEGHSVFFCGRNREEVRESENIFRDLLNNNNKCYGIKADISKEKDCIRFINAGIKKISGIDVLINNAGVIGEAGELQQISYKNFKKTFEINLFGTVNCIKYAIPHLSKSNFGTIINFSGGGVGGSKTMDNFSPYVVSKSAVVSLTEVVSKEVNKYGITINSVAPGAINTNITDSVLKQSKDLVGRDQYETISKQREKGGDDVKMVLGLVNFLISDSARNITGRLISAKWDKIDLLSEINKSLATDESFGKLRRIDNQLFFS